MYVYMQVRGSFFKFALQGKRRENINRKLFLFCSIFKCNPNIHFRSFNYLVYAFIKNVLAQPEKYVKTVSFTTLLLVNFFSRSCFFHFSDQISAIWWVVFKISKLAVIDTFRQFSPFSFFNNVFHRPKIEACSPVTEKPLFL